jgi:hypothetical protein
MLGRVYSNHDHKRGNHDRQSNKRNNHDCTTTSRKLALHNPVLRLKIAFIAKEENQYADTEECGAERLAHVS